MVANQLVRYTVAGALVMAALGCVAPDAVTASGLCVNAMRWNGKHYGTGGSWRSGESALAVPGAEVGTMTRMIECDDTPEPPFNPVEPLHDGESNFLAAGTTLHSVVGVPPSEKLLVRRGEFWTLLVTLPE